MMYPVYRTISVRLSLSCLRDICRHCLAHNITMNEFFENCISEYLARFPVSEAVDGFEETDNNSVQRRTKK